MATLVFILAGGSGTRLAPLSLTLPGKLPKQFLALVDKKTMLQETAERIPGGNKIIVVPELAYEQTVQEQLSKKIEILSEPFGCNTASALGLSALYALKQTNDENTILFFLPADHIMDKKAFQKYFATAVAVAEVTEKIVTIGIKPDRPETGYGYIKVSEETKVGNVSANQVEAFVEKPDLATAEKYVKEGNYFWNAGIFCLKIKTLLAALQKDAPLIHQHLKAINFEKDLKEEITREYSSIKKHKQNISIDYAVMEKEADNILLIKAGADLEWNDVGGWVALAKYNKPDANNNLIFNYLKTNIQLKNCRDLLIVTSENGILITTQALGQRAKEIIPGITEKETSEMIECENVTVNNTTKLYIGVIGLKNINIDFSGQELKVIS